MWACKPGCDENRRLLLEEGADVLIENEVGHSIAVIGDSWLLEAYLERGVVDGRDRSGMTILHQAAAKGDVKAIKTLIQHYADRMAKSIIDETPLLLAVVNMHEESTKELIAAGADVTFRDASGRSIIDYITTSSPLSAIFEVNSSNSHRVNAGVIPNDSIARFVRSVVRNIDSKPKLSRWNFWQDYIELAYLFLTIGRERDSHTRVCLETRLTAMHGGRTRYAASCEGCTRDYVESSSAFHICQTCYMQVICHDCYKKRIDEKKDACLSTSISSLVALNGRQWRLGQSTSRGK
jgi:hypothetical protein